MSSTEKGLEINVLITSMHHLLLTVFHLPSCLQHDSDPDWAGLPLLPWSISASQPRSRRRWVSHQAIEYLCCRIIHVYTTGWPNKNRMAYFPWYKDAITAISGWCIFSWELWNQDQQFWFSSLFSMAHFVRQCPRPNIFPFQLKHRGEWMSFRVIIDVSRNPINFINVHPLHQQPARLNMRIVKVKWMSAHNLYDKPK